MCKNGKNVYSFFEFSVLSKASLSISVNLVTSPREYSLGVVHTDFLSYHASTPLLDYVSGLVNV